MPVWLLLLLTGVGLAQDAPAPPPVAAAPQLRVMGFEARPDGACDDPSAARDGRCVDVVDFFPLDAAFEKRPLTAAQRAVLRDLGPLYAHALEDLAHRWNAGDIRQTLQAVGHRALPLPTETWKASDDTLHTYGLPRQDLFLGNRDWFSPTIQSTDPRRPGHIYPHLRYLGPEGQVTLPPTAVLTGRSALRLGAGGKLHDYDVMDADPGASLPFFEQMFPYTYAAGALGAQDTVYRARERIPLLSFRYRQDLIDGDPDASADRKALFAETVTDGGFEAIRKASAVHFDEFLRVVFVQTAQFAMEGYTTNQIRVLAALTALAMPPDALSEQTGLARALVAAARGETDTTEEILDRINNDGLSNVPLDVRIRYEALPRIVIEPWVARLAPTDDRAGPFFATLDARVRDSLQSVLRFDAPSLTSLDADARRAWLRDAVLPGEDRDEVDTQVLREAIKELLEDLTPSQRARIETWMLADQVRFAVASTFDDTRIATPTEVVIVAAEQWTTVLDLHGYSVAHLPQGLGAIDPVAVCSTLDGVEALDEPSFKSVHVDQIVAAPRGLSGDAVLAAVSHDLPFVFVDDPRRPPQVTWLMDLGDGRAAYRVRWQLWTGWHLLWGTAPHGDQDRLLLRTGTFCEDTVLASTDLVPTLVRAGMLHANMRPTTPERPSEAKRERKKVEMSSDEAVDQLASAPEQATAAQEKAAEVQALLEAPPVEEVATKKVEFAAQTYEIVQEDLRPATSYLRELVHTPLERSVGRGALMVFTFDATAPSSPRAVRELLPRTPYIREQERVRRREHGERIDKGEHYVRTAAWMWFFAPETRDRPVQISPAYTAKDSVAAGLPLPRWSRRSTTDFGFGFGLGGFPFHRVNWQCREGGEDVFNFSGDCANPGFLTSEGLTVDLQAMATWWGSDQPRIGLDAGIEARLDARPAGFSTLWGPNTTVDVPDPAKEPIYPWSLRFQAGLIVGFRHAPGAQPLYRSARDRRVWGASRGSGSANLSRFQWGMRTGLLLGPSFTGTEASTQLEVWLGWGSRRKVSANASFTPYHPMFVIGPFARGTVGFPLGPQTADPLRQLEVTHSWTAYLGLRGYLRLKQAGKLPEAK